MSNSNDRELELLTIRKLMQTENGRAFMWRSLQQTGIFTNDFDQNPVMLAYFSGQREHGAWLTNELKEAALDEYLKMIREHSHAT
jgi:hypothetical protein